jgi:riboflavin biosynthesis pyrimidine reductase
LPGVQQGSEWSAGQEAAKFPAAMPPRPQISANFAISADGKISSAARRPSGWTSAEDHRRLLELRAGADALLVGRGTLEADRMTLLVPPELAGGRQALRCVVSRRGRFDRAQPLFHTPGAPVHLLVTDPGTDFDPGSLTQLGASVHRGTLAQFLAELATVHQAGHVHCEGGGELLRELLERDWVDTLHLTWAGHHLFGGRDAPTITGVPGAFLPASRAFELLHFEPRPATGECFLSYRRVREAAE